MRTHLIDRVHRRTATVGRRDLHDYLSTDTRLATLLFWHLRRRGLTSTSDRTACRGSRGQYSRKTWQETFCLSEHLAKILAHFNRNAIEIRCIKGRLYLYDSLVRFRDAFVLSDIDLMVRPADLDASREMLMSDGYSLEQDEFDEWRSKQSFSGEDDCTTIDLHSGLFWAGVRINYTDYFLVGSVGDVTSRTRSAVTRTHAFSRARSVLSARARRDWTSSSPTERHIPALLSVSIHRLSPRDFGLDSALEKLKAKRTDRLLATYAHYGKRELGLLLPPELDKFRGAAGHLRYLDAVVGSSARMVDYNYRATVAALTSRNLRERLNEICRHAVIPVLRNRGKASAVKHVILVLVRLCLQFFAVLYVSAQ